MTPDDSRDLPKEGARIGWTAAVTLSLLLTAPLAAVLYAAWSLLSVPFIAFALFDRLARTLPGGLLTIGIDSLVRIVRTLEARDTAAAAKTAEHALAIALLIAAGVVAGAFIFAIWRRWPTVSRPTTGAVAGVLFGVLLLAAAAPAAGAAASWTLVPFFVWGWLLGAVARSFEGPALSPPAIATVRPSGPKTAAHVETVDRRTFIVRVGAASAVVTVAGAAIGMLSDEQDAIADPSRQWSSSHALPNAGADVAAVPGTRAELTPIDRHYRIDIDSIPPRIDGDAWRLAVSGLVDRPSAMTLADLRAMEPRHAFITLACISNPVGGDLIGTTRWTGVSLQRLLPRLALKPSATHLKIASVDGFFEVVPLDAVRSDARIMLAYAWDGVPLLREHGFPLRIYIPDVYGMKQPKWIRSIEATGRWEPGYWVVRGWDRTAQMKIVSVIDTIQTAAASSAAGRLVAIGGMAHAGARGISRVEVRVDAGAWQRARLRQPLSELTWVLWRYEWPFTPGRHRFTVRAFDGDGAPQITAVAPPHPSGASGLHTVTRRS